MMYKAMMTFGLGAAIAAIAACGGGSSTGGLDAERVFQVALTSSAGVPAPKPTSASGTAQILVYAERIDFQLSATSIAGITVAHIHSGAPGVAGSVVATLFLPAVPTAAISGLFASGSLSSGNLPAGVIFVPLKTLLASGNAYVDVHTIANPAGEIRGQVQ